MPLTHSSHRSTGIVAPSNYDGCVNWIAPIARWAVWQEDLLNPQTPAVQFVDSSLRRKLSPLAKMALKVAHDCAGDLHNIRLVYASRHGDITRTTNLLVDLAEEEAPSPTAFSMSVLNATPGVYSIAMNDQSPSTAVSAIASSFGFGLLEACMQLASQPASPVLFVYADEMPPALYAVNDETYMQHAVGLLLSSDANIEVSCTMSASQAQNSLISQSQAFLDCLNNGETSIWHGEGRAWRWFRHAG
jgi:hypothetical protein